MKPPSPARRGGDTTRVVPPSHSHGAKGTVESSRAAAVRRQVKTVATVIGASLVALVSGTPNAFNAEAGAIQTSIGASTLFMSTMTGLGVAGLFVSLPAGVLSDSYGTPVAAVGGGTAIVAGYLAMSYVSAVPGLLMVCNGLVGLGSGCTFLAALSTAINTKKSWAVAVVSLCMSMSISFTIMLLNLYDQYQEVVQPDDWRGYVQLLAVVCGGCVSLGALAIYLGEDSAAEEPGVSRDRSLSMDGEITFLESLRILRRLDFWLLFCSNMVGIGGGVFIVTSIQQVWRNFADPSQFSWGRRIVILFSVCNAVGNVVSPIASEWLHCHGKLQRARYTSGVLAFMAFVFFWLAAFTISPTLRHGPWACDAAYIALMATVGFGYGSFLTLFPTLVAETYGLRNFGTYVSYMQVGSALASLAIPAATSSVFDEFHVYSPMHVALGCCSLLGAAFMWLGHFKSLSFDSLRGVREHKRALASQRDSDTPSSNADSLLVRSPRGTLHARVEAGESDEASWHCTCAANATVTGGGAPGRRSLSRCDQHGHSRHCPVHTRHTYGSTSASYPALPLDRPGVAPSDAAPPRSASFDRDIDLERQAAAAPFVFQAF